MLRSGSFFPAGFCGIAPGENFVNSSIINEFVADSASKIETQKDFNSASVADFIAWSMAAFDNFLVLFIELIVAGGSQEECKNFERKASSIKLNLAGDKREWMKVFNSLSFAAFSFASTSLSVSLERRRKDIKISDDWRKIDSFIF